MVGSVGTDLLLLLKLHDNKDRQGQRVQSPQQKRYWGGGVGFASPPKKLAG